MKTILNGRHFRNLALLPLAVLLPVIGQSQEAADLRVIARTGQAGLTTINNSVSINNAGLAAFSGITAAGRGSFVADANGPREVRPINSGTLVANNLQLNDAGTLVARRGTFFFTQPPIGTDLGFSESYDFVQTWAADGTGGLALIAEGRSRTDGQTLQTNKVGPFASVGTRVTINNAGQVAFVADQGTGLVNNYVLATAKGGNEFNTYSAFLGAAPMIADTGRIVARPGSTDGNPILLFNYDFTSPETVASAGSGFTVMGRMPGFSDDGQYVAFYGDLSSTGAVALGTSAGPGIFLSYPWSGVRRIVRLAGLTNVGSRTAFNSFDGNQRVGVNRRTADGKVLVAFFGTNATGIKGIWAAQFDPANPTEILLVKIILQSDLVDGIGPWDDFRLSDPVNTLGQVACWAQSGTQQAVLRGTVPGAQSHVPLEGGVRAVAKVPASIGAAIGSVQAFVDTDGNGALSPGEKAIDCSDVRGGTDADGKRVVYFTPPTYITGTDGWPPIPENGQPQPVRLLVAGQTLVEQLEYTKDVVKGVFAIQDGLKIAITEAMLDQDAAFGPEKRLQTWVTKAGAIAETVLLQVLGRAKAYNRAVPDPAAVAERTKLVPLLEQIPWMLQNHINAEKPADANFRAVALPINYGHSQNRRLPSHDYQVLMTLGTGTLAFINTTLTVSPEPVALPLTGGELYLKQDFSNGQTFLPITIISDNTTAHGWQFDGLVVHPQYGLQIDGLANGLAIRGPFFQSSREKVARKLSLPAVSLHNGGTVQSVNLDAGHLSHIYINKDVLPEVPRNPSPDDPKVAWMVTATYRIPTDSSPTTGNQPQKALVVRQSYALTDPFQDFEPAHAMRSANIYPQITFFISDPNASGAGPQMVKMTHRLALNPLEGRNRFLPEQYVAGLFRDLDNPKYWATSRVPSARVICQPVPFWWNMFDNSGNTVPLIAREMVFDTRKTVAFPTPDNLHLHHIHFYQLADWRPIHTEAPGSFDGTIHFHWRWGRAYGPEFGDGELLIPDNQDWVMGIARSDFPKDGFQDFTTELHNVDIQTAEKVLLVRCEQCAVQAQRQYYTFTTGLSYGLGSSFVSAALPDFIASHGGYNLIAGYPELGWGPSTPSIVIRAGEQTFIDMAIRSLNVLSFDFARRAALKRVVAVFSNQQDCLAAASNAALRYQMLAAPVVAPFASVTFSEEIKGQFTPVTVIAGGTAVTFSSTHGADDFFVGENLFLGALGYNLAQASGRPGSKLNVSFNAPIRQVKNLPVVVRANSGTPTITIEMFFGGVSKGSIHLMTSVIGQFAEATVNLDPGQTFDGFTVLSDDPSKEFAIGGFEITQMVIKPGDLNYDGFVDANDMTLFTEVYSGSGAAAQFLGRDADLDHDGDVDAADYQSLRLVLETPAPASAIAVSASPAAALEPVMIGQRVPLAVAAIDLAGGSLSYAWTADYGSFNQPASSMPVWKAPSQIPESYVDVSLSLTIQSSGGASKTLKFNQPVVKPFPNNNAPVTVNDTARVLGSAATNVAVLANDTDADNDALRVDEVTQGTHGTVTIAQDGKSITYSPGPTFINGDEFSYTVTDDRGGFMQANVTVTLGDVAVFVFAGKGMQIPGEPPGTVFATFGAPSINPVGMTAFAATYRTPTARTKRGIFTGLPVQALAREGDPAPGTSLAFGTFSDPVMNRVGAVAFKAKLVRASAATAEGLWLTDSGAPALVVRQADAAAGVAGAFFRRLLDVALPDNGELLFTASLMTGRGGVTAANDFGLWRRKADGQLQLVLRKGDQIVDGTISRRVKTLAIFGALSGTTGQRRGFDNSSDTLLRISFTDGVSALLLVPAGGSPEMLLRTGQSVAALGGAMIRGFSLPVLSDDGGVAVLATLTIARGGPVADNDTVILHRRADGTIRLVAREGVALLDPPAAVPKRFGDPVSGSKDALAFAGILKIPSGGVRIGTDVGLWRSDASGALKSLVREGAVAPGTGGGTFASFQSLVWAGSRGLAFTAKLNLRAGVVVAANDTGLWAENADGQLSLLLRKNDRISIGGATKRIQTLTVLSAVLDSPSQGHSFNSDGGFAVRATFTDGSQAILTVWVP